MSYGDSLGQPLDHFACLGGRGEGPGGHRLVGLRAAGGAAEALAAAAGGGAGSALECRWGGLGSNLKI